MIEILNEYFLKLFIMNILKSTNISFVIYIYIHELASLSEADALTR